MSLLRRIEELPPNRRSSQVGMAGVIKELRNLPLDEAVIWLKENISSPVSSDWGRHLCSLGVDWVVLKQWMHLDKIHALAAVDAIDYSLSFTESLPENCSTSDAISEIKQLYSTYQSLRIKKVLEAVEIFSSPPSLSRNTKNAAQILMGPENEIPIIYAKAKINQWDSLLNKADRQYCLVILDWRATEEEQENAISLLPICQRMNELSGDELIVETIDRGNDEIILIALTREDIEKFKKLAPRRYKFKINDKQT